MKTFNKNRTMGRALALMLELEKEENRKRDLERENSVLQKETAEMKNTLSIISDVVKPFSKETKIKTPIQKVVPVKEKKDEKLFSLYIDTEKLKQLKILSAEKNKSLKDLINEALEKTYF